MTTGAYYNEIDPQKAAWLRELINRGLIASGDVDERSIKDVKATDVMGYTQCHWFAGIGVWSYALRLAGWNDNRPVWTGSCPCPSFSAAGKGEGFADARHLWPEWYRLICECRPSVVFGEQVAAAVGHGWLDLVCGNLEAEEYAVAAAVLGAHSVGAPHRRQRLYFVADTESQEQHGDAGVGRLTRGTSQQERRQLGRGSDAGFCADTASQRHDGRRTGEESNGIEEAQRRGGERESERLRDAGFCAHTDDARPFDDEQSAHGWWSATTTERSGAGRGSHPERDGGRPDKPKRGEEGRTLDGRDCATGDDHNSCCIGRGARRNDDGSNDRPIVDTESISCNRGYPAQRRLSMCGSASGDGGNASQPSEPERNQHALSARIQGHFGDVREWRGPGWLDPRMARSVAEAGATRGFWADCDWWYGRDDKFRPIGPGIQPLAHGVANRVVKLRGYGDSIVSEAAAAFIEAYMEAVL